MVEPQCKHNLNAMQAEKSLYLLRLFCNQMNLQLSFSSFDFHFFAIFIFVYVGKFSKFDSNTKTEFAHDLRCVR